jgi:predicted RNA binding protein YcfA (HicA-like mRNA interferase family)
MTYYDVVKLLKANGWESIKLYQDRETWSKGNKTVVLMVHDRLPKKLVNSIISMG